MTKSKTSTNKSERIVFAEAISALSKTQEDFQLAVQNLENFQTNTLQSLDIQITDKKTELDELAKEFEKQKKDGQIEVDQFVAEYRYNAAVDILEEREEVAIDQDELQALRDELETIKETHQEELEAVRTEEKDASKKAIAIATKTANLEHQAAVAGLNATVEQQEHEIENLRRVIENLRDDVSAQRELTQRVAEATKQGAINQTIGK